MSLRRPPWDVLITCVVVLGAACLAVVVARPASAAPAPAADVRAQTVYVVTDSVGLSAKSALPAAFPPGWQVNLEGHAAAFVESLEKTVRQTAAQRPWAIGDHAVVAAGYNYPYWDPARFDRSIDSIIAALREAGVRHVYWVTLREVKPQFVSASAWRGVQRYNWYFPEVNEHLRAALDRHPDLELIDWTAVADRPGLTYDAIHLNTTGAALYSQTVAGAVLGTVGRPAAGTTTRVHVAGVGAVPADAQAAALNLAVTSARTAGFLTAYPCGEPLPVAANLTFARSQTVSGAAVVPIGDGGDVCIYNSAATHVVADLMGGFTAGGGYLRAGPQRLTDTRGSGGTPGAGSEVRVALPAGIASAAGVVLEVTAIAGAEAGFVTAYPCGAAVPAVSHVNFDAGAITPNLVVVAPGDGGAVCLRANRAADLVVDLFGGLSDAAVDLPGAVRGLDTRTAGGAAVPGADLVVATGAAGAAGVVLNITATEAAADVVLAARACGTPAPPTANLNVAAGGTRGNVAVVTPDAEGRVCVTATAPTHVVVDVMGSLPGGFVGLPVPIRLIDTRAT